MADDNDDTHHQPTIDRVGFAVVEGLGMNCMLNNTCEICSFSSAYMHFIMSLAVLKLRHIDLNKFDSDAAFLAEPECLAAFKDAHEFMIKKLQATYNYKVTGNPDATRH